MLKTSQVNIKLRTFRIIPYTTFDKNCKEGSDTQVGRPTTDARRSLGVGRKRIRSNHCRVPFFSTELAEWRKFVFSISSSLHRNQIFAMKK